MQARIHKPYKRKPILERFLQKVEVNKETSCWIWIGAKAYNYGYFHVGINGKGLVRAHRFSYEVYKGAIPHKMEVCHTCDNPSCVNPEHLWLGTTKQNAVDRDKKGRHWVPKGENSCHSVITQEVVNNIRNEYKAKYGAMTSLAKKYGLQQQHVEKILNNKIWRI